jgi:hypothetical protein
MMAMDLLPPQLVLMSVLGSAVWAATHAQASLDLYVRMGPVLGKMHVIMQVITEDLWA